MAASACAKVSASLTAACGRQLRHRLVELCLLSNVNGGPPVRDGGGMLPLPNMHPHVMCVAKAPVAWAAMGMLVRSDYQLSAVSLTTGLGGGGGKVSVACGV